MMDSIRCACGTHTKAACDFAGACGQLPANPLALRGVVYQVQLSEVHSGFEAWGTAWQDVSEDAYNRAPEAHRRTLYTAPVPATAPAEQPEGKPFFKANAAELARDLPIDLE